MQALLQCCNLATRWPANTRRMQLGPCMCRSRAAAAAAAAADAAHLVPPQRWGPAWVCGRFSCMGAVAGGGLHIAQLTHLRLPATPY